jgi:PBS lyase HEAT-like repeat
LTKVLEFAPILDTKTAFEEEPWDTRTEPCAADALVKIGSPSALKAVFRVVMKSPMPDPIISAQDRQRFPTPFGYFITGFLTREIARQIEGKNDTRAKELGALLGVIEISQTRYPQYPQQLTKIEFEPKVLSAWLIELVKDKDAMIFRRANASVVLGGGRTWQISTEMENAKESVPIMIEFLEELLKSKGTDGTFPKGTSQSIGKIAFGLSNLGPHADAAVPVLVKVLSGDGIVDDEVKQLDKNNPQRAEPSCAAALGRMGSPAALAALTKAMKKEKRVEVRSNAVTGLGQLARWTKIDPNTPKLNPKVVTGAKEAFVLLQVIAETDEDLGVQRQAETIIREMHKDFDPKTGKIKNK